MGYLARLVPPYHISHVRSVCEVTRYPENIVTPEADLEEDLGIHSVKLAEIIAAI